MPFIRFDRKELMHANLKKIIGMISPQGAMN